MSLTVNSNIIANVAVQGLRLRALLGAFELSLVLGGSVNPARDTARWLVIHSARVTMKWSNGIQSEIGLLVPDRPVDIRQQAFPMQLQAMHFNLLMLSQQFAALEDQRDGQDVDFEAV